MTALLLPNGKQSFRDNSGRPLVGGKVYFYEANTQTPKNTYQDSQLTILNTNPVVLDARGEALLYGTGDYRILLKDSIGNTIWDILASMPISASDLSSSGGSLVSFLGPDGQLHPLNDIANNTDITKGAALIGYKPNGANSTGRTVRSKLLESASIADYGGIDDGVFDNSAALATAKLMLPPGSILRFNRQRQNSNYLIPGNPDFSNLIVEVDEGVVLSGSFFPSPSIKVRRSSTVFNTTLSYNYELSSQYKKAWTDRSIFMSDADKDLTNMSALDTTNDLVALSTDYLTGDTWASSSHIPQSDGVFWNQSTTSKLYASMTSSCRPGDELSCSFSTGGAYKRVAIIRTTNGYHLVSCDAGNATPLLTAKITGNAAVSNSFSFTGQGSYASYFGENSHWTIRIYDHQSFSVLWSGQEITNRQVANGPIIQIGFGWVPSTITAITIQGFARARNIVTGGKRDITLLTIGDSLTEWIQGGWQSSLQEAIDMTDSIRVNSIISQAVGGQTSAQQLALLQSLGVQGAQYALICVGTNDIQGGVPASTTVSNISTMIDLIRSQGAIPIMWIPPLWYPNTFTSGTGQNTSGYQAGAPTRALLLRLAGAKGCKCVDLTQVMGTTVATYRMNAATAGFDPVLKDNLHPSTYGYRMIGWAIARALLGLYGGEVTREMSAAFLPASGLKNGWLMNLEPPTFGFDSSGFCYLTGTLEPGTATANTVIYNLPEMVRPLRTVRATVVTSAGICNLGINTNGDIYLITAPPGGSIWVSMAVPPFKTSQ